MAGTLSVRRKILLAIGGGAVLVTSASCGGGSSHSASTSSGGSAGKSGATTGGSAGKSGATTGGSAGKSGATTGGTMSSGGAGAGGGSGPTTVTLTVERGTVAANAELAAFQDGDGDWQVAVGSNGVYQEMVSDERYGFSVVCTNATRAVIKTFQLTISETPELTIDCLALPAAHQLSGTVTGLSTGDSAQISFGPSVVSVQSPSTSYMLETSSGNFDFAAVRSASSTTDKIVLTRNVAVNADVTQDVNFTTQGFAPESHAATVTNTLPGATAVSSSLVTNLGTWVGMGSNSSSSEWLAFPAAETETNDVYVVRALSFNADFSRDRGASLWLTDPSDVSLDLPPDVGLSDVQAYATSPAVLFDFTWNAAPSVNVYQLDANNSGGDLSWNAELSSGWLGASATYDYRQPDLSGLAGWDSSWDFAGGAPFSWIIRQTSSSLGVAGALTQHQQPPSAALDGVTGSFASKYGGVTVP